MQTSEQTSAGEAGEGGSCREGGKPAVNKWSENSKPYCYRENSQATKCFIFLVLTIARSCLSSPKRLCHSPVEAPEFPFVLWKVVATHSPTKKGSYQFIGYYQSWKSTATFNPRGYLQEGKKQGDVKPCQETATQHSSSG